MQIGTIVGEPGMTTQNPRISNLLLASGEFLMCHIKSVENKGTSSIFIHFTFFIQMYSMVARNKADLR